MKKFQWIFAFLCVAIISCNPSDDSNSDTNPDTDFAKNFGASVSRDFIGQVVDANNVAIQNARISIGMSTVQTDVNGVFIINGASVHEKFAYITAKKAGYIDGSRAMVPTNGKNNVKIMMISATPIATIASGTSSEVALPSGTKVLFDGAFETESGAAYSGNVSVSMFHLTPSNQDISSLMPGMLYAQATDGSAKVLETFGMMQVELRGSGGEKLQIAKTHTAQIKMQIDASQMATAPSSIPLWHFDEAKGYWTEEGSATKVGNQYVGNVSHFSWWGCCSGFPVVGLSVNILDSNSNPIPYLLVNLTSSAGFTTVGELDNNGNVSGCILAGEVLTLNVYSPYCPNGTNNSIYTTSIGPFTTNTILPTITLPNFSLSTHVIGQLLKCDNTNVNNGYVVIKNGYHTLISSVSNGVIDINVPYCNSDTNFTVEAFDYDSFQSTGIINYNFSAPITHVGSLTVCNTVTEFISYQIDGGQIFTAFSGLGATIDANFLYIGGVDAVNINEGGISIIGSVIIPGIYNINQFSFHGGGANLSNQPVNNTATFNLNNVGAVGEFIDVTFMGTYEDTISNVIVTKNINGIAHVIRDN